MVDGTTENGGTVVATAVVNGVEQSQQQQPAAAEPTAEVIGQAFLSTYYRMWSEKPDQLYKFYSHESIICHDNVQAVGQEKIQTVMAERIPHEHLVRVFQVKGAFVGGPDIVLQVCGEFETPGEHRRPRRFVQSFVLNQQAQKKYYVQSDIFQYLDVAFKETESGKGKGSGSKVTSSGRKSTRVVVQKGAHGGDKPNGVEKPAKQDKNVEKSAGEKQPLTNGKNTASAKKDETKKEKDAGKENTVPTTPKRERAPPQGATKDQEQKEERSSPRKAHQQKTNQQAPPAAPNQTAAAPPDPSPVTAEPPAPPVPQSWASLVSQSQSKPPPAPIQKPKPVQTAPPAPAAQNTNASGNVRTGGPPRNEQQQQQQQQQQQIVAPPEARIYISNIVRRNLVESTQPLRVQLREELSKYGDVHEVSLTKRYVEDPLENNGYAFVTMRSAADAQKVYSASKWDEKLECYLLSMNLRAVGHNGEVHIKPQRDRNEPGSGGGGGGPRQSTGSRDRVRQSDIFDRTLADVQDRNPPRRRD